MLNPLKSSKRDGPLEFAKMAGGGNDFVIVDNRSQLVADPERLARAICTRRLSVGADGLILVESSARATFRMRYYNSDGSMGEFCANGTRCAARFAFMSVIAPRRMTIETGAGVVGAEIHDRQVELNLGPPRDFVDGRTIRLDSGATVPGCSLLVGVPHFVTFIDEGIWGIEVEAPGREIRHHRDLAPAGANVDWVEIRDRGSIAVRTYERGVEAETLSCGSGVVASVMAGATRGALESPVEVLTRSGIRYQVSWTHSSDGAISAVSLRGDARIVYRAELTTETIDGFDPEWVRDPHDPGPSVP